MYTLANLNCFIQMLSGGGGGAGCVGGVGMGTHDTAQKDSIDTTVSTVKTPDSNK